ncbi:MAG: RraA family protein [Pyramidobacter sp.]|jgi:regulator of RNase E activity RraA
MSVGFRVYTKRNLPSKELVEAFRHIPAPNIADTMNRLCAIHSDIHLMTKPGNSNMVGVALTVKARPGDNLMLHKALNMIEPGDVVVVSNEGDRSQSLMGEVMAAYAKSRGVAGFVLDGPMRDIDSLYDGDVPFYATGTTPGGPFKEGPGEINVPIACGGIMVNPGDIIVGDPDGVIVIPRQDAEKVLEAARKFMEQDQGKFKAAQEGNAKRDWVDKKLMEKGCEIIDGTYPA